jgi:hypothetical protein
MTSRTVPLHLATFAIVTPNNNPLYVHSYTGVQDELRYHHIAHSALDIIEERGKGDSSRMLVAITF